MESELLYLLLSCILLALASVLLDTCIREYICVVSSPPPTHSIGVGE